MNASIFAISKYLPTSILSNTDLCKAFPELNETDIYKKTGILNRHISADQEFGSDMAVAAAEQLFQEHAIDRSEVDFLIYCSETLDYRAPATACLIQDRLNLPTHCGAIDVPLGCTGFTYSLSLAKALIESGQAKKVLILNSDTSSKVIHPKDLELRMIFGDAATASLIIATEQETGSAIGNFVFGTDGSGAENLIVKRSASRNAIDIDWLREHQEFGGMPYGKMEMNSIEIFNFALRIVPTLLNEVLLKNQITLQEIDFVVFHQANTFLLQVLRRKLKIEEKKFVICMENTGNTVSASIPLCLIELMETKKIRKGQKILIAGFGIGYSWSATVWTV